MHVCVFLYVSQKLDKGDMRPRVEMSWVGADKHDRRKYSFHWTEFQHEVRGRG